MTACEDTLARPFVCELRQPQGTGLLVVIEDALSNYRIFDIFEELDTDMSGSLYLRLSKLQNSWSAASNFGVR